MQSLGGTNFVHCVWVMTLKVEIIEKYFEARLSTAVKFPLFLYSPIHWLLALNGLDKIFKAQKWASCSLRAELLAFSTYLLLISSVSLVSHSLFGPQSLHQWNNADSFLWVKKVGYENYTRKFSGMCRLAVVKSSTLESDHLGWNFYLCFLQAMQNNSRGLSLSPRFWSRRWQ